MFEAIVKKAEYYVWNFGIPVADQEIPLLVIALLGTGIFVTFRLGFIQLRRLGHGVAVTSGIYDDPDDPGDVSHFQALTTALSATVGIGNIAGVAIAIHWGGPGALFWMWMTAIFGMALKFTEVTLAQHYRSVGVGGAWQGSVAGGPMYYIEKGLGPAWRPVAVFVAGALVAVACLGSNAVQANTVADNLRAEFDLPTWISGLATSALVALVIVGGIRRIGRVTSILAPLMALVYVVGALIILGSNIGEVPAAFMTIFREAFSPSAGVAGTGAGAFLVTLMWGVRRGLYSNEAGEGSAPIAHAAAQTKEPVSEGVVALLEPFIDTILICTMTGLVIVTTGVWNERFPTEITFNKGDVTYVLRADPSTSGDTPAQISVTDGRPAGDVVLAWHEVPVERFYVDAELTVAWSGTIYPEDGKAVARDGSEFPHLYGPAVENGAPLTKLAYERGLGDWGGYIVVMCVLLFGVSTAISWSYYGDRAMFYLTGNKGILPFRIVYVVLHFTGAILALSTVWTISDVALGLLTLPNLIAVVMLSGVVVKLNRDYFERRPWLEPKARKDGR